MSDYIPTEQIAYKKVVGSLHGNKVVEMATRGGLHLIVTAKGNKVETLGVASHRAVAKHIAKKRNPDINWTELSKADHVAEEHFAFCLPRYEALTDEFRRLEGSEE